MPSIAIIGTAGRKQSAPLLNRDSFERMCAAVRICAQKLVGARPWRAVSGGAAFADHCAVRLFLDGTATELLLELPAEMLPDGSLIDTGVVDFVRNPGGTLNYYHRSFAAKLGHDPRADFIAVRARPGCSLRVTPGLHARNKQVAQADHCIALTFGQGGLVADGGTAFTMGLFLRKGIGTSVHVDLNSFQAFSPARVADSNPTANRRR